MKSNNRKKELTGNREKFRQINKEEGKHSNSK